MCVCVCVCVCVNILIAICRTILWNYMKFLMYSI